MSGIIILCDQEAATNADILQGTRLQTSPERGTLLFEIQASDNNATDNYTVTIQLPDGGTPVTAQRATCGNTTGLSGVIDDRVAFNSRFGVDAGGHTVFSCIETGDAELTWRVTFTPG